MTLTSIISELSNKQLNRLLNTNKAYLYFKISVFNVGANIQIFCTDNYKHISNRTWNGYDFCTENNCLINHIAQTELNERLN
jgi:hypothetical protein